MHRQGPQRRLPGARLRAARRGSAPTRSAPRTTRTPRTSSTTPTGTASCVIDETAAVGLNMGLGGGIFGAQGYQTFSPDTINDRRTRGARAGDPRAHRAGQEPPERRAVVDRQRARVGHRGGRGLLPRRCSTWPATADPTRPVGFVNVMLAPHGKCRVSQFADVLMLNRYYGWYVAHRRPRRRRGGLEEELRGWAGEGKPIIITEYGADTLPGLHARGAAAVDRGVPGGVPGDEPPGVRPHRRRRRRARVELRRLRHHVGDHARRAATRRASSPATAAPRPPRSRCAGGGAMAVLGAGSGDGGLPNDEVRRGGDGGSGRSGLQLGVGAPAPPRGPGDRRPHHRPRVRRTRPRCCAWRPRSSRLGRGRTCCRRSAEATFRVGGWRSLFT